MSTIKIEGLDKLAQVLKTLPDAIAKKRLAKPVAQATMLIRNDAIRRAPVGDTGVLEKAILMKKIPAGALAAQYIVAVRHGKKAQTVKRKGGIVNLDAYYWTFLEFGTSHINPAKPFMRPAFEANKEKALTIIVDGIRAGVELEAAAMAWSKG